jgi:nucleotide-binding universal stress UspA family protein
VTKPEGSGRPGGRRDAVLEAVLAAQEEHEVIAGYDGSQTSARALDWAVREARLRDLPLTVCHAWTPGYTAEGGDAADPARGWAEAVLARGVRHAQERASGLTPRPLLVCGSAARVLCEQCAGAGMLVVGSRGSGGFPGLLLGSVSFQVAGHAAVPVTVVPCRGRDIPGDQPAPIVVGTDGSPASRAALEFAATEAALRDVPLVAVCALSDAAGVFGVAHSIEADFIAEVGKVRADHPDVLIQARTEHGTPRTALLTAASRAQLLVVGVRGRGGLRDMPLGSVTVALLHHARCPITVVRAS